jgi:NAD(P)H-dependent FMN reductase
MMRSFIPLSNIAVFVGSVRRDRKGIRVARWIERKLQERNPKVYFIDPMGLDLPLLDRMYKEMDDPSEKLVELRNKIKDAEGMFQLRQSITEVHQVR